MRGSLYSKAEMVLGKSSLLADWIQQVWLGSMVYRRPACLMPVSSASCQGSDPSLSLLTGPGMTFTPAPLGSCPAALRRPLPSGSRCARSPGRSSSRETCMTCAARGPSCPAVPGARIQMRLTRRPCGAQPSSPSLGSWPAYLSWH